MKFTQSWAIRCINDSITLCERLLLETSVAVLPGFSFERPVDELTTRLSYVNFNGTKALAESETIPIHNPLPEDFIERICEDTIAGIKKIAEWVSEK